MAFGIVSLGITLGIVAGLPLVLVETEQLVIGRQVTIQPKFPITIWVLSGSLSQKVRHAQLTTSFHDQMKAVCFRSGLSRSWRHKLYLEMPLTHTPAILLHSLFCQNPHQRPHEEFPMTSWWRKKKTQALFTVGFAQYAATTQKSIVGILQPHTGVALEEEW